MRNGIRLSVFSLALLGAAILFAPSGPAVAARKGNPAAMVELGRRLFFDPAASRAGKFSCADCHRPDAGFSDPRRVSVDENGPTRRHSQTLLDLKDGSGFHWDGEFDHLDQLLTARVAPVPDVMRQTRELTKSHFLTAKARGAAPSEREYRKKMQSLTPPYYGPDVPVSGTPRPRPQAILARLRDDGRYEEAFRTAFGSPDPTTERIVDSMKAYLLSLASGRNRYDDYLDGEPRALTAPERRGLRLFEGKAGCAQCHVSRPDGDGFAKFTDYSYRNTGVAYRNLKLRFDKKPEIDHGLGGQTFASADIGRFKVPSLRDVARRAPYMHDGSLATLEDVIGYYEKGGTTNGRIDRKLHAFDLDDGERADLLAFLRALTSKERPGLGDPARGRPDSIRARLVGRDGRPVRDLTLKVSAFGDRLRGAPRETAPRAVTSDSGGYVTVPLPLWTHVKLTAPGYEIGYDRPLPDTLRRTITLLAVPRRRVYVEVHRHPEGKPLPSILKGAAMGDESRGARVKLQRVRSLGSGRALYVMDRIPDVKRLLVRFDLGANTAATLREIDVRGGSSEPLDFRE